MVHHNQINLIFIVHFVLEEESNELIVNCAQRNQTALSESSAWCFQSLAMEYGQAIPRTLRMHNIFGGKREGCDFDHGP